MPRLRILPCRTLLRATGLLLVLGSFALTSACVWFASSASVTSAASLISSASSSEILSSPFRSSARSSDSDEEQQEQEQQHEEEIKIYTASYLAVDGAAGDGFDGFERGLSIIATRRGISDWESSPTTWIGAGRGLATAGLHPQLAADYAQSWSGGDPEILALLELGYGSVEPDK